MTNTIPKGQRQKADCDVCGFTYAKEDLLEQNGRLVCETDYDDPNPADEVIIDE